ncbi:MAG: hypothetical protein NTW21_22520 [Verrucomicrobia bacterium]|nr:hypothetical protein [Verrucomicrobiota bacterium]
MVNAPFRISGAYDTGSSLIQIQADSGDGKACNFATCRPRKTAMWLAIALPKSEEIDAMLAASDIDLLEYNSRDRRYRFRLGEGDVSKHAVILKDILKRGYDRRNAE